MIPNHIYEGVFPQMNTLNMVIPILMHLRKIVVLSKIKSGKNHLKAHVIQEIGHNL